MGNWRPIKQERAINVLYGRKAIKGKSILPSASYLQIPHGAIRLIFKLNLIIDLSSAIYLLYSAHYYP